MLYLLLACFLVLAALYLNHVNNAMKRVPEEARKASPHRWTVDEVKAAYRKALEDPVDTTKAVPPKQSRRYIVVGGSGAYFIEPCRLVSNKQKYPGQS